MRLSVWRFLLLLACLSMFLFFVCFPSPAAKLDHVKSSIVIFMKERREDAERTLAEGKNNNMFDGALTYVWMWVFKIAVLLWRFIWNMTYAADDLILYRPTTRDQCC